MYRQLSESSERPSLSRWEEIDFEIHLRISKRFSDALDLAMDTDTEINLDDELSKYRLLPYFLHETTRRLGCLRASTECIIQRMKRGERDRDPTEVYDTAIKMMIEDAKVLAAETMELRANLIASGLPSPSPPPSSTTPQTHDDLLDALYDTHECARVIYSKPEDRDYWCRPEDRLRRISLTSWDQVTPEKYTRADGYKKSVIQRLIDMDSTMTLSGDLANYQMLPHLLHIPPTYKYTRSSGKVKQIVVESSPLLDSLKIMTKKAVERGKRCRECDPTDIYDTAIRMVVEDAKMLVEEYVQLRDILKSALTVDDSIESAPEIMKAPERRDSVERDGRDSLEIGSAHELANDIHSNDVANDCDDYWEFRKYFP